MLDIFSYSFIIRGLIAGLIIAGIAPLIGIFLVLRRYSLIADTLAHVSLAGIAIGLFSGIPPIIMSGITSICSSLFIEHLRTSKKVYGESALAIFLSGSLAIAILMLSVSKKISSQLFSYLFGSITTVSAIDLWTIIVLGIVVACIIISIYKELCFISFDEETAQVSGLPVQTLNAVFILLCATVISLSIPIVGMLLISALIVIPVVSALQLRLSFRSTLIWSEIFSFFSVISGMILSILLDLPTGATIVLMTLIVFLSTLMYHGWEREI